MYIPWISVWALEVLLVLMCTRKSYVHTLNTFQGGMEVLLVLMCTRESHVHSLNTFLGPGSSACINVYKEVPCTYLEYLPGPWKFYFYKCVQGRLMYIPWLPSWALEVLLVLMCTRESHVHTLNICLGPGSSACINVYKGVSCTS